MTVFLLNKPLKNKHKLPRRHVPTPLRKAKGNKNNARTVFGAKHTNINKSECSKH